MIGDTLILLHQCGKSVGFSDLLEFEWKYEA